MALRTLCTGGLCFLPVFLTCCLLALMLLLIGKIDQTSDNCIDSPVSVRNEPFTLDEMTRYIANLFVGKCSGINGIRAIFKATMDDIASIDLNLSDDYGGIEVTCSSLFYIVSSSY